MLERRWRCSRNGETRMASPTRSSACRERPAIRGRRGGAWCGGVETGGVISSGGEGEGATRLWEQQPEAMRAALARHDALLAAGIQQHEGQVVKSRGEGDSLFAVFARATDALAAAADLQQALIAAAWPTADPLRVRMALHTGEAELRDGDYFGPAVNRCARL